MATMGEEKLKIARGYKLQVSDLMRYVELGENFTLGDQCQMICDSDEMDIETLSSLVQCPLDPFIEECLSPFDVAEDLEYDLHYIRLHWSCEYDNLTETRWPPSTSVWLHVDGIGDIWDDCKPGGQFYKDGKDFSNHNQYAIEMTPLYKLRHLPIRIDPIMTVGPYLAEDLEKEPLEIPALGVTLLQLIYYMFWELSFIGTPEERDVQREELRERVRRIDTGEEKLIPLEDLWKELDEK